MIPGPKIVVIDDDERSLEAIQRSIAANGTSCFAVPVVGGEPRLPHILTGVRLLFLDIHLLVGGVTGAAAYDIAGTVLEKVLDRNNGPYVLVTWTSHPDEHDALLKHISGHYPNIPPPIASMQMAKQQFMATGGAQFDFQKISDEIAHIAERSPQAHALMCWEDAVTRAGGDLVSTLAGLVSREDMFLGRAGPRLERLVTTIAQRSVGRENVAASRLTAVNEGFLPLLLDRLSHLPDAARDLEQVWAAAIPAPGTAVNLTPEDCAKLNSMYHLALSAAGPIRKGSRGAVYKIPAELDFEAWFGKDLKGIFGDYTQTKDATPEGIAIFEGDIEWMLVTIKTACDDAQSTGGLNRVVLAAEIPVIRPAGTGASAKGAVVCSPEYERDGKMRLLVINWLYVLGLTDADLEQHKLEPLFRLRDSLCTYLERQFSSHASRPGIIDLKKP